MGQCAIEHVEGLSLLVVGHARQGQVGGGEGEVVGGVGVKGAEGAHRLLGETAKPGEAGGEEASALQLLDAVEPIAQRCRVGGGNGGGALRCAAGLQREQRRSFQVGEARPEPPVLSLVRRLDEELVPAGVQRHLGPQIVVLPAVHRLFREHQGVVEPGPRRRGGRELQERRLIRRAVDVGDKGRRRSAHWAR